MYNVTITHYESKRETTTPVASFSDAVSMHQGAAQVVEVLGWTRHCNFLSTVRHMDNIHDLFNEGSIVVSPVS